MTSPMFGSGFAGMVDTQVRANKEDVATSSSTELSDMELMEHRATKKNQSKNTKRKGDLRSQQQRKRRIVRAPINTVDPVEHISDSESENDETTRTTMPSGILRASHTRQGHCGDRRSLGRKSAAPIPSAPRTIPLARAEEVVIDSSDEDGNNVSDNHNVNVPEDMVVDGWDSEDEIDIDLQNQTRDATMASMLTGATTASNSTSTTNNESPGVTTQSFLDKLGPRKKPHPSPSKSFINSAKKSKPPKKNGLAEQLQKAMKLSNSDFAMWRHSRNSGRKHAGGSLVVRIISVTKLYGVQIAACDVLFGHFFNQIDVVFDILQENIKPGAHIQIDAPWQECTLSSDRRVVCSVNKAVTIEPMDDYSACLKIATPQVLNEPRSSGRGKKVQTRLHDKEQSSEDEQEPLRPMALFADSIAVKQVKSPVFRCRQRLNTLHATVAAIWTSSPKVIRGSQIWTVEQSHECSDEIELLSVLLVSRDHCGSLFLLQVDSNTAPAWLAVKPTNQITLEFCDIVNKLPIASWLHLTNHWNIKQRAAEYLFRVEWTASSVLRG